MTHHIFSQNTIELKSNYIRRRIREITSEIEELSNCRIVTNNIQDYIDGLKLEIIGLQSDVEKLTNPEKM